MLTRIDHVMICVPDLARGMDDYARIGFSIHPGGVHPGKGTHNAIAFNQADYVELLAIRDRSEYRSASAWQGLIEFIESGGGLRYIILQSDDLEADVAAMRSRGVDIGDAADALKRRGPGPFKILYRTASMDAAERWMTASGLPPPARGVRNAGERTMLVPSDFAGGVYLGLVGPG